MTIAVSIVLCLVGQPNVCRTLPLHLSVDSMVACTMAGEEVAARLASSADGDDKVWRLDHVRCSPGFVDEHQG